MTCGIYRIINKLNGKCYVGQSVNIDRRFKDHERRYREYTGNPFSKLYNILHKNGLVNFRADILELCEPRELNQREVFWINYYNSFRDGYNMTIGGDGFGRGEDCPTSKLTEKEVMEIKKLLLNPEIPMKYIAELYGINVENISSINTGETWSHTGDKTLTYPIRRNPYDPKFCSVCGSKVSWNSKTGRCYKHAPLLKGSPNGNLNDDSVSEMKFLLKNNKELNYIDISNMFKISIRTLTRINYGESWTHVDSEIYTYPIREHIHEYMYTCVRCGDRVSKDSKLGYCMKCAGVNRRGSNNPFSKLTESDVYNIKKLLKHKLNVTIREIASKYGVGRSTIQEINKGKTWSHVKFENCEYPIR